MLSLDEKAEIDTIEIEKIRNLIQEDTKYLKSIGVYDVAITHSRVTGLYFGYHIMIVLENEDPRIISQLPENIKGIHVVYWIIGKIVPAGLPLTAGSLIVGGTVGGFALDSSDPKKVCLITNAHVLCGSQPTILCVGQLMATYMGPGIGYVGIGYLKSYAFSQDAGYDCAAVTIYESFVLDTTCNYRIRSPIAPYIGMSIKKAGLSGCQEGVILGIGNNIYITGSMVVGGDSGSLVVERDSNRVVGLIWGQGTSGGSPAGLANPISNVEQSLGVSFATHKECIDGVCKDILGPGPDLCTVDTDCSIIGSHTGQIVCTADKPGAKIYLDNVDTGYVTPYTLPVKTGGHKVTYSLFTYYDKPTVVNVNSGQLVDNSIVLTPWPGNLDITSTPSGAQIYINGVNTNLITPNTVSISVGYNILTLLLTGYQDYNRGVIIESMKTLILNVTLIPTTAGTGSLYIASNPAGARVWIDEIDKGVNTPRTIYNISPTSHTYTLKLAGYQDKSGTFDIIANQTKVISDTLTSTCNGLSVQMTI